MELAGEHTLKGNQKGGEGDESGPGDRRKRPSGGEPAGVSTRGHGVSRSRRPSGARAPRGRGRAELKAHVRTSGGRRD